MAKVKKGETVVTDYGEAEVISVAKSGNVLIKYTTGTLKGREARVPSGLLKKKAES